MVPWTHPSYPLPNRHLLSAVFAVLTNVTNRHTHHVTPSVAIGRILCTECQECGVGLGASVPRPRLGLAGQRLGVGLGLGASVPRPRLGLAGQRLGLSASVLRPRLGLAGQRLGVGLGLGLEALVHIASACDVA